MRNPINMLSSLQTHSSDRSYIFERLYRNLFNRDLFLLAYQNIYSSQGNMTKGADGKTVDAMSMARIDELIAKLRDESYQPQPSRRTYIPKKNGKMRPLGIPSFDDKLVQEALRMMLEAIYEGNFEDISHGFRPNHSCHTALNQIQVCFTGAKWFVEGDIKGFFDNINHDKMVSILAEKIHDERFLRLIRKFLKAGYLEDWQFHNTYSGTPQGGIISPILANIYLDKLDKFMKNLKRDFDKGTKRRANPQGKDIHAQCHATGSTQKTARPLRKGVQTGLPCRKRRQLLHGHLRGRGQKGQEETALRDCQQPRSGPILQGEHRPQRSARPGAADRRERLSVEMYPENRHHGVVLREYTGRAL